MYVKMCKTLIQRRLFYSIKRRAQFLFQCRMWIYVCSASLGLVRRKKLCLSLSLSVNFECVALQGHPRTLSLPCVCVRQSVLISSLNCGRITQRHSSLVLVSFSEAPPQKYIINTVLHQSMSQVFEVELCTDHRSLFYVEIKMQSVVLLIRKLTHRFFFCSRVSEEQRKNLFGIVVDYEVKVKLCLGTLSSLSG